MATVLATLLFVVNFAFIVFIVSGDTGDLSLFMLWFVLCISPDFVALRCLYICCCRRGCLASAWKWMSDPAERQFRREERRQGAFAAAVEAEIPEQAPQPAALAPEPVARTPPAILTRKQIERLLSKLATEDSSSETLADVCSICLETQLAETGRSVSLERGPVVKFPICQHGFHFSCITRWMVGGRESCPVCRRNILGLTASD